MDNLAASAKHALLKVSVKFGSVSECSNITHFDFFDYLLLQNVHVLWLSQSIYIESFI